MSQFNTGRIFDKGAMRNRNVWKSTVAARVDARGRWSSLAGLVLAMLLVGCQGKPAQLALPDGEGALLVRLSGLRNDVGVAIISLFAGAQGFPDDLAAATATATVPVKDGQAEALFSAIRYGEYAVCALHDEDGDGQMATSLMGTPREGFGFSGRPGYRFGPPEFEETRFFLVVPHQELEIVIRYETGRREHQETGQSGKIRRSPE